MNFSIIVLGGYGNFGGNIARRLARHREIRVIIAGRNFEKAQRFADLLANEAQQPVQALRLDASSPSLSHELANKYAQLLIHTSGPFQLQDYRVAEACIRNHMHYMDLADDRTFVKDFSKLQEYAQQQGILAISGVSTVPGLSSAVMNALLPEFHSVESLDYGISPGNRSERGVATVAAILSYTGHVFTSLQGGTAKPLFGWQDIHRHPFPSPMGMRWMANCEIPDLSLFPQRYRSLQSIRFYAGLELSFMHIGMWIMSWMARIGLVKNWAEYARSITAISRWFQGFGSDTGGMYLRLQGTDHSGKKLRVQWHLIAEQGDGPLIPAIPAVILAKKLALGELRITGAMPCMDLFSLAEFSAEVKDLAISQTIQRELQ